MEYIQFAFAGVNVIPSAFLIIVISYWLLIILGIFSFDMIDFDLDFDLDFELDFSSNMYFDGGVEPDEKSSNPGIMKLYLFKLLKFLNIGAVPVMIYCTILFLVWWILSMLVYYISISPDSFAGVLITVQNFVISVFIAKGITEPLKKFFASMEDRSDVKIIGKTCILKSSLNSENIAQAEIMIDGYPIIINVKSLGETIIKGSRVVVAAKEKEKNLYIVKEKLNN